MAARRYMLDADVFITAKNGYYAFDICPGFWASVIHHHRAGRTFSIDRVRNELIMGRKTEDLVQWVTRDLPSTFLLTNEERAPESKREVKLLDVCAQFEVPYTDTFARKEAAS